MTAMTATTNELYGLTREDRAKGGSRGVVRRDDSENCQGRGVGRVAICRVRRDQAEGDGNVYEEIVYIIHIFETRGTLKGMQKS